MGDNYKGKLETNYINEPRGESELATWNCMYTYSHPDVCVYTISTVTFSKTNGLICPTILLLLLYVCEVLQVD